MVKKTIKKYIIKKVKKKGGAGNFLEEEKNRMDYNSSVFKNNYNNNFNLEVIIKSLKELLILSQNSKELKNKIINQVENKVNELKPEDSPFLFQLKETSLELLENINNYIEKCIEIMMANNINQQKKNWYKIVLASDLVCYIPTPIIKLLSEKVNNTLIKIENNNDTFLSASDKVSNNAFRNMLEILKSIFDIYYKICAIKNKLANIYLAIDNKENLKKQGGWKKTKIKTKKFKKKYYKY